MNIDGIELENMYWSDEYDYEGVEQVRLRSQTGALHVFERAQQGGQPMNLIGAWVTHVVLAQLQALRKQAGLVMSVELDDGRVFSVVFDREGKSIEAVKVSGSSTNPQPEDLYEVAIKLLIIGGA